MPSVMLILVYINKNGGMYYKVGASIRICFFKCAYNQQHCQFLKNQFLETNLENFGYLS